MEQRRIDRYDVERAELELGSVSQPWLNIIYLLKAVLGVFSTGGYLGLGDPRSPTYFAPPPPVSAGSSTVTDQSTLLDSITRYEK